VQKKAKKGDTSADEEITLSDKKKPATKGSMA